VLAVLAALVVAVTGALATSPDAQGRQAGLVTWFNDPPGLVGWVLQLTNPLFRPVPLAILGAAIALWLALTAGSWITRLELVRAALISIVLAEVGAQILKRVADQDRPTEVLAGLDSHGYPKDPSGNAYPSAHTAFVVAVVAAMWPWLRPSQRIAGVVLAVLVALNRLYIGAHWPLDVAGGAAVGLFAAIAVWRAAARWPIRSSRLIGSLDHSGDRGIEKPPDKDR